MDDEQLQRRRAERAHARRRRRQRRRAGLGMAAVIVVVLAVVGIVLGTAGGSGRADRSAAAPARGGAVTTNDATVRRRVSGRSVADRLGPATGRPGDARVPILMYHVIHAPFADSPYPGLYVPPAEFAAQMAALAHAGWHGVTLDDVRANWLHGNQLPTKPVVITFDNGYLSQYSQALPVLRRLGWVADENIQLTGLPPAQGGMTTDQVRALVRAGWELDTQGISHADLPDLTASELATQVDTARAELRRRYHVAVNWFCYPSGQYDPAVVAAVAHDGFVGSTTVVPGWASRADDAYALPRLRVLGGTSPAALLAQIAAARDAAPPPSAYTTSS